MTRAETSDVNQVDAPAPPLLVVEVALGQMLNDLGGLLATAVEHGAAEDDLARLLVEWTRLVSNKALATRAVVLRRLVEEDGVPVAEAARRLGVSRQMARRILGEADKTTLEGVFDGLRRLHGAAFRSWLARMDAETLARLADGIERQRGAAATAERSAEA